MPISDAFTSLVPGADGGKSATDEQLTSNQFSPPLSQSLGRRSIGSVLEAQTTAACASSSNPSVAPKIQKPWLDLRVRSSLNKSEELDLVTTTRQMSAAIERASGDIKPCPLLHPSSKEETLAKSALKKTTDPKGQRPARAVSFTNTKIGFEEEKSQPRRLHQTVPVTNTVYDHPNQATFASQVDGWVTAEQSLENVRPLPPSPSTSRPILGGPSLPDRYGRVKSQGSSGSNEDAVARRARQIVSVINQAGSLSSRRGTGVQSSLRRASDWTDKISRPLTPQLSLPGASLQEEEKPFSVVDRGFATPFNKSADGIEIPGGQRGESKHAREGRGGSPFAPGQAHKTAGSASDAPKTPTWDRFMEGL